MTTFLQGIDDNELDVMTSRAWREAARCVAEARRERHADVRRLLEENAAAANDFWRILSDEQTRREREANGYFQWDA